jgi:thiamine-phosphate pyrophosphorylase
MTGSNLRSSLDERRQRLARMHLYVITADVPGADLLRAAEAALEGGADVVQLRHKSLPAAELYQLGVRLRALTLRRDALLIVNDHADLALACGADGVHLGQDDLEPAVVRALPGFQHLLIGRSTHTLAQAQQAEQDGVDYIGVGPIFSTPTKPGRPGVGLELVGEVAARIRLPFVAIGGIDATSVASVIDAGARAVAVVRAVSNAPDPRAAAQSLQAIIEERVAAAV